MSDLAETTMPAIFQNRVSRHQDKPCVGYKTRRGDYLHLSWNELLDKVHQLASWLLDKGVEPGDRIALFSPNRYEWWVTDLAVLSIGAVDVPIYASNSAEEAAYVLEHSGAKMCLAATRDHVDKILMVKDTLPEPGEIISFEPVKDQAGVTSFADVLAAGQSIRNDEAVRRRLQELKPEQCATIIYTSGTTGNPKGVMLSHHNLVINARQAYAVAPSILDRQPHTLLSFLPLSHCLERSIGFYNIINGSTIHPHEVIFAEDFSKILENFQEVRPSFIVSVPRLYEKIHAGIIAKTSQASPLKKAIFNRAMNVAARNLPFNCNDRRRTGLFALEYWLFDHLVFAGLKETLGMDNLAIAISGGGPLSVSDAEFFLGMDIKVIEGYGLTETTPLTHANRPSSIKPGTVGTPVLDTEARINPADGEVQIRGPQVMLGYYRDEKATREVMTTDGWFKTGDIGKIDDEGNLQITGRIKEVIITSGGKNISPQNIENELKTSPYIEQVAVIGDNRKYLSALVVPAFERLEAWAREQNLPPHTREELLASKEVIALFGEEIENHMSAFARVEQIRRFTILDQEWSQETDELTPTLKLKRRVINAKFAQEIEDMYPKD